MKRAISLYLSISLLISGLALNPYISIADTSTPIGLSKSSGDWLKGGAKSQQQLHQLPIRASAPALTHTLFMPAIVTPDCGDVTGQVIQAGQPLAGKDVTLFYYQYDPYRRLMQTPFYTATTDARGYFTLRCVDSTLAPGELYYTASPFYTIAVFGNRELGQPEIWSTNIFTLTRAQNLLVPSLTLETLHIVDPISGTITLPYTFVLTSTYPNYTGGTAISLIIRGQTGILGSRGTYVLNIPGDVFTATVKSGDIQFVCTSQCDVRLRIVEPNGFGDSFSNDISIANE